MKFSWKKIENWWRWKMRFLRRPFWFFFCFISVKNPALLYKVTFFSSLWMVFPESWRRSCSNFYAHDCNSHNFVVSLERHPLKAQFWKDMELISPVWKGVVDSQNPGFCMGLPGLYLLDNIDQFGSLCAVHTSLVTWRHLSNLSRLIATRITAWKRFVYENTLDRQLGF